MALSLISGCHTLNHLQYSITSVIFPVMMNELGFGLLQLGMLSAISNFVGQGLQVIYGFFTGFFKRPWFSESAMFSSAFPPCRNFSSAAILNF